MPFAMIQVDAGLTREHCKVDSETYHDLQVALGAARFYSPTDGRFQIRVTSDDIHTVYALFTVVAQVPAVRDASGTVRRVLYLGNDGLNIRLDGARAGDPVEIHAQVSDAPHFWECERRSANDGLVILTPHGGDIEPGTYEQGDYVYSRFTCRDNSPIDYFFWFCQGNLHGADYDRLHITSTDISSRTFPRLSTLLASNGFRYTLAFHGFSESSTDERVVIGGLCPQALKANIRSKINGLDPSIDVIIVNPGVGPTTSYDAFSGSASNNIINRLVRTGQGGVRNSIQVEQNVAARAKRSTRLMIAEGVFQALSEAGL